MEQQVTSIIRRQSQLHSMMDEVAPLLGGKNESIGHKIHRHDPVTEEFLPYDVDGQKYHISKEEKNFLSLSEWLSDHRKDVAFIVSILS
jgi:hypothetical protein